MRAIRTINQPVPFRGTREEAEANYQSHKWWHDPESWDMMCDHCGSKGWHKAAEYPCGVEPPREDVIIVVDSNGNVYECDPSLFALGIMGKP